MDNGRPRKPPKLSPAQRAFQAWTGNPNPTTTTNLDPDILDQFAAKCSTSYLTYGSLCLLPAAAFDLVPPDTPDLPTLYEHLANQLHLTHIATTRPIPLHTDAAEATSENVLRSPLNFTPLYGDFGPSSLSNSGVPDPVRQDFDLAYWTTTKQNAIYQTWAPRWTMFSRGNIAEKARLLTLPSVVQAAEDTRGFAVVDLYIGIGYFAFSYLKAGAKVVLGWDLNGWSVEGCRRGAQQNRWGVQVVARDGEPLREEETRLFVFHESNDQAAERIENLREWLPPIRHVNCGLLPTSKPSWKTAVNALELTLDGWIHVHENWATQEIETRTNSLRDEFQLLIGQDAGKVTIDGVHRLKSYAPGVMHCVVDVHIPARTPKHEV